MSNTFNLRRAALYLIAAAIFIAIANILSVFILTSQLKQQQAAAETINLAAEKAHEGQYHVSQVQQFLTDVSATADRDAFDDAKDHYKSMHKILDDLAVLKPESKLVFADTRSKLDEFYKVGNAMAEAYIAKGRDDGNAMMKEPQTGFDARAEALILSMESFITPLEAENASIHALVNEKTKQLRLAILAISLLSTLGLIAAIYYFNRRLFAYLGGEPSVLHEIAQRISSGQLNTAVPVAYNDNSSMMAQMHKMQNNLQNLIAKIQQSAHTINTGAQEIAAGNAHLSNRTEQQASSLEETASSMEQMASTVKQNAENANQANQMAKEASSVAIKGGEAVNQVVGTMLEINASSKKIVDIISVIDGIAFQTNILALNAAVEAARAGDQGRGFGVVAAEVRSLAQRSAAAAKEIKQLIGESVDKVSSGTKLVEEAGNTMDEVVTAVKMVTDIVNEIAAASQEQSAGIDQVNNAITNMDEVTQQNAALVEEAEAAANSLEHLANELIHSVSVFKLSADNHLLQQEPAVSSFNEVNLNKVNAPQAKELPAEKKAAPRSRLKSPKTKKDDGDDWEEF
jgi:methyl-accepting chemotaxis protein